MMLPATHSILIFLFLLISCNFSENKDDSKNGFAKHKFNKKFKKNSYKVSFFYPEKWDLDTNTDNINPRLEFIVYKDMGGDYREFRPNVNLVIDQFKNWGDSKEEYVKTTLHQMKQRFSNFEIVKNNASSGERKANNIIYEYDLNNKRIRIDLFILFYNGIAINLSLATSPDQHEKLRPIFEEMVKKVQIKKL